MTKQQTEINCLDCEDTGRLWRKTCHCQATSEPQRACVKCNVKKELNESNFELNEKPDICNQGFSWHCKKCLADLRAL